MASMYAESDETWDARGNTNHRETLARQVRMWPTPKGSPSGPDYARAGRDGSGGDDLATAVARMWPTPTKAIADGGQTSRSGKRKGEPLLAGMAGGQLNPTWVEWLMGFPLGWTDCGASATPSSRKSHT